MFNAHKHSNTENEESARAVKIEDNDKSCWTKCDSCAAATNYAIVVVVLIHLLSSLVRTFIQALMSNWVFFFFINGLSDS